MKLLKCLSPNTGSLALIYLSLILVLLYLLLSYIYPLSLIFSIAILLGGFVHLGIFKENESLQICLVMSAGDGIEEFHVRVVLERVTSTRSLLRRTEVGVCLDSSPALRPPSQVLVQEW